MTGGSLEIQAGSVHAVIEVNEVQALQKLRLEMSIRGMAEHGSP
jgi:hypothetical protein